MLLTSWFCRSRRRLLRISPPLLYLLLINVFCRRKTPRPIITIGQERVTNALILSILPYSGWKEKDKAGQKVANCPSQNRESKFNDHNKETSCFFFFSPFYDRSIRETSTYALNFRNKQDDDNGYPSINPATGRPPSQSLQKSNQTEPSTFGGHRSRFYDEPHQAK